MTEKSTNRTQQTYATAKRLGLFDAARALTRRRVRILHYSGLRLGDDPAAAGSLITPEVFTRRLRLIRQWGYPVIPLDMAMAALDHKYVLATNAIVITIDGDHPSALSQMLPLLERHGMSATVYLDAAQPPPSRRTELQDAGERGFAFGLKLAPEMLGPADAQGLDEAIGNSRRALADLLGIYAEDLRHAAASLPSIPAATQAALARLGFVSTTAAVTGLVTKKTPPHQLPRLKDSDEIDELAFEAELSGFASLLRRDRNSSGRPTAMVKQKPQSVGSTAR